MQRLTALLVVFAAFGLTSNGWAADPQLENHFATIQVDGKKIGQVHYTLQRDEQGEIETLKTRASMSILGINLYSFSQDLNEQWASGELQAMDGHTDDDGKKFTVSLARKPAEYTAVLNDNSMTLPHDAFPNSVWHYAITEQSLLFDLIDLKLIKVDVSKRQERIKIDKKNVDAERFDFTGDWKATLWFDQDRQLLRLKYVVQGRDVVITLDQD
jgi:hypothetical protein